MIKQISLHKIFKLQLNSQNTIIIKTKYVVFNTAIARMNPVLSDHNQKTEKNQIKCCFRLLIDCFFVCLRQLECLWVIDLPFQTIRIDWKVETESFK